ncbi:MAG: tail fiber domain-containing protein [Chitinophagaceae bacterium]|nr:tail fiber domain-containing protein [Chitinophagaceae bacterium]
MKRNYLLLITFLFAGHFAKAQSLAINTDGSTANASALLDVKSTLKGVLIPRMTKAERTAIASPAIGLLVFQNAPDSIGFYYYEGSKWNWVAAVNGNADSIAWKRNGNAGTNPATHFIGTTDNRALNFRVNNIKSGLIDNVSYNSSLGFSGFLNNSSGTHNTAIGFQSMTSNTIGNYNTAVGAFSFYSNTTGIRNTAMGTSALYFNNANDNTAVGYESLNQSSSTAAKNNTAVGANSSRQNISGTANTAIGDSAGYLSTTASYNVLIGKNAGRDNLGSWTTIIGIDAGPKNTANGSVFVGSSAGMKNTSGSGNTFVGDNAGRDVVTGSGNSFLGSYAGQLNTGSNNTFIGSSGGYSNTFGTENSFVGRSAGFANSSGNNNTFMGSFAGNLNSTGSDNSFYGKSAGANNLTGYNNVFSGSQAGISNSTGYNNIAIGYKAMEDNSTGYSNTFVGMNAGNNNITGSGNSFFGDNTGAAMRSSNANALFGSYTMGFYCDTCSYNSAFGVNAASSVSKGDKNSFFGYNIANGLKVGYENTVMGYQASVGDTADQNVVIGSFAGGKGDENVFIGHDAGKNNSLSTMNGSTYVGSWAGFFKRASYSLLLGYSSSVLADGYSNASAIGAFSRVDTSNAMVLGSTGINIGIGITKPYQAKVTIAGSGNTLGIFGIGQAGISLQQNGPTIGYNQYRDISAGNATRYMANGYAWVNYMDQASGNMYWNSMPSGTANGAGGAETVRMTLTNTGSLGLNVVPNGNGQLQFQNTIDNRKIVLWENANTSIDFYGFGINGGTLRYQIPAVGNVHSFVAGNTALLNIFGTGNATLAGTLTQLSDVRLKENIVPINNTLNDLKKINAYSYYWKDENKDRDQQIGLLAQEVDAVFPQLVKKDAEGLLG